MKEELDRSRHTVVLCRRGRRSQQAHPLLPLPQGNLGGCYVREFFMLLHTSKPADASCGFDAINAATAWPPAQVAEFLARQGFEWVSNVAGGITAFSLQVDPSVSRY